MDSMHNNPEKNLEKWAEQGGPPQLQAALNGLFPTPQIPRALDDQILAAARAQSAGRNRARWVLRYAVGPIAAAAAVIVIAIKTTHHDQPAANNPAAVASAEDVNKDGKLDMIDAYLMARKVAANEPLTPEWDFNHDGSIDSKDVDVVAFGAVKLKGGDVR